METILSYMAKERFCSYRGRHVELCKHSNFAYMEKEGANAWDNITKCIPVLAAEENQPAAIVINGPETYLRPQLIVFV